jgi:catechol 2,3-dioxygenase-like lactoylglutathione lyase family enzyme
MNKSDRRIKGRGEVSIRVNNLNAMHKFYEEVVGLEVLGRDESLVFFKIAEGYGGHTHNFALFSATNRFFIETKSSQLSPEGTTLHHIALNVALEDSELERRRLVVLVDPLLARSSAAAGWARLLWSLACACSRKAEFSFDSPSVLRVTFPA